MNNEERKYRFSEIMSAVDMLPSIEVDSPVTPESAEMVGEWILPDTTKGLLDERMKNAILCQAFRENDEFKFKLIALLSNSALKGFREARENDTKPSEEDLQALAICANILWADGQAKGLFQLLGLIGNVCSNFEVPLPTLSTVFLRSNNGVDRYGKLSPISILEGNVSYDNVRNALAEE